MKINCEVAKDLLPQYYDGTLKEDTKDLVKAHLDECEECRAYFEEIKKINEELDKGEMPETPQMGEIGALNKIKKRLAHKRLVTVIVTIAAIFVVLLGAYIYANMHYTYIPYEDTGIVVKGNEIRTSRNYARLMGISDEINGENVEFIFLLSNTMSNINDLKGEITILNMDAVTAERGPENEAVSIDITDKVYYLPESAIGKLPFLVHTGYMQDDLADPDYWKQLEENIEQYELVWSREG